MVVTLQGGLPPAVLHVHALHALTRQISMLISTLEDSYAMKVGCRIAPRFSFSRLLFGLYVLQSRPSCCSRARNAPLEQDFARDLRGIAIRSQQRPSPREAHQILILLADSRSSRHSYATTQRRAGEGQWAVLR